MLASIMFSDYFLEYAWAVSVSGFRGKTMREKSDFMPSSITAGVFFIS